MSLTTSAALAATAPSVATPAQPKRANTMPASAEPADIPRNIEPTRSALSRLRAVRSRPYTIVWWAMRDA